MDYSTDTTPTNTQTPTFEDQNESITSLEQKEYSKTARAAAYYHSAMDIPAIIEPSLFALICKH
jgi:hypothetical protein